MDSNTHHQGGKTRRGDEGKRYWFCLDMGNFSYVVFFQLEKPAQNGDLAQEPYPSEKYKISVSFIYGRQRKSCNEIIPYRESID
jgi:hypothetical protein